MGILTVPFVGDSAIVCPQFDFVWRCKAVWMDIAYAAGSQGARGMGELFNSIFLFLPLIVIFYFLIFRPQQKQRREMQEMLANLKKGDSIVTRGGIEAIIDKVEEKRLRIDVGNGLRMWMRRDYVDRVETK
jgi:preprotein translocase subunit YajC